MIHDRLFFIPKTACLGLAMLALTAVPIMAQQPLAGASSLFVETTAAISTNVQGFTAVPAYFAPFTGSTTIHTDTFASLSAMLVAK